MQTDILSEGLEGFSEKWQGIIRSDRLNQHGGRAGEYAFEQLSKDSPKGLSSLSDQGLAARREKAEAFLEHVAALRYGGDERPLEALFSEWNR